MTSTRREFLCASAALALANSKMAMAAETTSSEKTELWYAGPAERWMEALPIGNGRIGGMVFGGVGTGRIALTESTVWSGAPGQHDVSPTALEHLAPIRALLFAGKYEEANEQCKQHLLGRGKSFGTSLPMANLEIAFDAAGGATDYRRWLDLDEAVSHVSYRRGDCRFEREAFCSNPDDVLMVRASGSSRGAIRCGISFGKLVLPGEVRAEADDTLVLGGNAFEHLHSNGRQGVRFEARLRVVAEGGTVRRDGLSLRVEGADAVTIMVAAASDFQGANPEQRCASALAAAGARSYTQLRAAHVADYQRLFKRVLIDLGHDAEAESHSTDERRKAVAAGKFDPGLSALFFQYGRYLTIAGSRANSPLPLALQGIWNDGLASSMGWTDDFHLDINTEQNYWAAEVANLSECQTPLFPLLDTMRRAGQSTARQMYGAPGWVAHVVTNPWGYTAPGEGLGWGIFVTGGVWLSLQLWEHYRFTADRQFLAQRAYPVLKDAAEFYLSYMVEHPRYGWLVTGPSESPENWFVSPEGKPCSDSMGPTVDRVLVFALLSACIESSETLKVDSEFRARAKQALDKLPPLRIGRHGQVQEWLEDFDEAQPNHRHTSHLIALYPEHQISPSATPELAKAARVTIERRTNQPNWEDAEWSRANLVNYYARLLDGDSANRHLAGLLAHATEDSLLTYSRGGVAGAESNIFAIDGNCAGAAGIAEMLLQSQAGEIHLLPALPSAWPNGSVQGLCARGAVNVSLGWREGRLESARLLSQIGGERRVRYADKVVRVVLEPGRSKTVRAANFL